MIDTVLGSKIKIDKKLFELWESLDYKDFEDIVRNMNGDRFIKITFSDLFNGNFKHLKYKKLLGHVLPIDRATKNVGNDFNEQMMVKL